MPLMQPSCHYAEFETPVLNGHGKYMPSYGMLQAASLSLRKRVALAQQ